MNLLPRTSAGAQQSAFAGSLVLSFIADFNCTRCITSANGGQEDSAIWSRICDAYSSVRQSEVRVVWQRNLFAAGIDVYLISLSVICLFLLYNLPVSLFRSSLLNRTLFMDPNLNQSLVTHSVTAVISRRIISSVIWSLILKMEAEEASFKCGCEFGAWRCMHTLKKKKKKKKKKLRELLQFWAASVTVSLSVSVRCQRAKYFVLYYYS